MNFFNSKCNHIKTETGAETDTDVGSIDKNLENKSTKEQDWVSPFPSDQTYLTPTGKLNVYCKKHFQHFCYCCGSSKHQSKNCDRYSTITTELCKKCMIGFHKNCYRSLEGSRSFDFKTDGPENLSDLTSFEKIKSLLINITENVETLQRRFNEMEKQLSSSDLTRERKILNAVEKVCETICLIESRQKERESFYEKIATIIGNVVLAGIAGLIIFLWYTSTKRHE
jgi:hypothetical protein